MRWVIVVASACFWGAAAGYAMQPQPLQFANTPPRVQVVEKTTVRVVVKEDEPQKPVSIGDMPIFNNPRFVSQVISSVKARTNRIARDQKAYLDDIENKEGKEARKRAEEQLARYQLLGMDESGMDYKTYRNKVNADPKGAIQDMLNRIDVRKPANQTPEETQVFSEISDAQFTLKTGMPVREFMGALGQEDNKPKVQGETLWTK